MLAISVSPTRVQFLIDAAVTPSHPRFRRRERGEHFDFRRITLDFADVRLVAWRGQGSAALRTLGELGHIDSFVWLGNEFRLEGLWGRMVIVGNDPRVRFEKSQARRMRRLRQERGAALHSGAMQELKNTQDRRRTIATILTLIGGEIAAIRRILYLFQDVVEPERGELELRMVDGSVLLLDAGRDGEVLRVTTNAWVDPFGGELSPESIEFVRVSGKWTAFDVSEDPEYLPFIGSTIFNAHVHRVESRKATGITIVTSAGTIVGRALFDEFEVQLAPRFGPAV